MQIEEYIPLSRFTTFKIGGPARFFIRARSVTDLKNALEFAQGRKLPFFILGGGSNILAPDAGFAGVVIKNEISGLDISKKNTHDVLVKVGSGENWDLLVMLFSAKGLFGAENLAGIPGTVGATPVQNIGAYGTEIKDIVDSVEVLNSKTGRLRKMENAECKFAYRESIFKRKEGKDLIITSVTFRLKKKGKLNLEYKDIQKYFADKKIEPKTPEEVRCAVLEIRAGKFPDLKTCGTAGSFFKNVIISKKQYEKLLKKFPSMPSYPMGKKELKIPTAWILDTVCGFRGVREKNVGTFERQALVLVNHGGASAREVRDLAIKMQKAVKQKTGIAIEFEVCFLS